MVDQFELKYQGIRVTVLDNGGVRLIPPKREP